MQQRNHKEKNMAKAEKKVLPPQQPHYTFTLHLDQPEAEFLLALTSLICGHSDLTRRKYADAIGSALRAAGVTYYTTADAQQNRTICFLENAELSTEPPVKGRI
jgi:hypothetical protein